MEKSRQLSVSVYDRISDPISFVESFGKSMAESRMFGCSNQAQGRILAMACLSERCTPTELLQKYHLIGGRLTMRSDAMLAQFRTRGGNHSIIERTGDAAEIELTYKRSKVKFRFTWEEAKLEDYVYSRDGKTPKDNWSTPRRRMQMLWARLVSDSVRAMMPEVVAGSYTPEEIDVSGTVVAAATAAEDAAVSAETQDDIDEYLQSLVETGDDDDDENWIVAQPDEPTPVAVAEPEPVAEQRPAAGPESLPDIPDDEKAATTRKITEINAGIDILGLSDAFVKAVLAKVDCDGAIIDLDFEQADRIILWLDGRIKKEDDAKKLEEWAARLGKPEAAVQPA